MLELPSVISSLQKPRCLSPAWLAAPLIASLGPAGPRSPHAPRQAELGAAQALRVLIRAVA